MLIHLSLLIFVLFALMLPFELETPWLQLGPVVFTNLEVLQFLVLIFAGVVWWQRRRPSFHLPAAWIFLGVGFVVALFLSSLFTPEFRANAFKASLRTLGGIGLALAVPQLVFSQRRLVWVIAGLITGGLIAVLIGLAELVHGAEFAWLRVFREIPTMAGPYLRLSGPFKYANQAAMTIEALLPLLVGFTWTAYLRRRRFLTGLLVIATMLTLQAGILTFSRSNFATILLVNLVLAGLLWLGLSLRQKRFSYVWAGVASTVVLLIFVNAAVSPGFRLRLTSEGDQEWYRAHFDVPAEISMEASETLMVPVTVINEGALTWRSNGDNPIHLVAQWVQAPENLAWAEQPQWPLDQEVPPGEQLSMVVPVQAPQKAGEYRLIWDLAQENIVWFGAKSGVITKSQVTVVGNATATDTAEADMPLTEAREFLPPIPERRTLWAIGWELFQDHPLLGIGLDNFRLVYGRYLNYDSWDQTIHTNNWYLETLVSLGVLGSLPFFAWLALLVGDMAQTLRQGPATIWQAGIAGGLFAYLIHGVLDYFLLFNTTGLLFWLFVGLWLSQKTVTKETP